jgi:hypothetical protein
MLVGQIAWEKMTGRARSEATALAALLPNNYNDNRGYHVVTAGCWLDDMRSAPRYAWSKWHYVTIPWTSDGSGFQLPRGPHVVSILHEQLATLKKRELSRGERAQAFAVIVHCIGDSHQPLHATDRDDRGGNGVLIQGVPFSDLWPGTVPNLHAFWDKAYRFDASADGKRIVELWQCGGVIDRPAAPYDGVIAREASKIMERFPDQPGELSSPEFRPVDWVAESHHAGCRAGYPPRVQAEDARDGVIVLDAEFAHRSREIACARIARAGYRTAALLNRVFAAPVETRARRE